MHTYACAHTQTHSHTYMDMYGHTQSILIFIEHIHADTHAHTPITNAYTIHIHANTHIKSEEIVQSSESV